jgi:hypothetical protein
MGGVKQSLQLTDCREQGPLDAQYLRYLRNFPTFMKQHVNVLDYIVEPD